MADRRIHERILRGIGRFLRRRSRPRQTRLYCVGGPRTGTHSVAAIFDRSIRSRHEPEFRAVTKKVLARHRGLISFADLRDFVRERDERLALDVDSSHANVFLIDALLAEFADARFLLTIRDCYSWTDSAMNHALNTRRPSAAVREYLEFYFDTKHFAYTPHDELLRQRGLPGVDCLLAAWRRHIDSVLGAVPPAKLLIVRTSELSAMRQGIADFAGVPRQRIAPAFRVRGSAKAAHGILARIDSAYFADRVGVHCGELMARFFPDVRSLGDALAARSPSR